MNYLILSEYDSLVECDGCVINGSKIRFLTKDELKSLEVTGKYNDTFDSEKIEQYIHSHNLQPCITIRVIDGYIIAPCQ